MTNAYSQAPWRKQVQVAVGFLLVLVMAALVASVYLYVSSQAVASGVQVQTVQATMTSMRLAIEDYETELAKLTSEKVMAERAEDLGFEPVDPGTLRYLEVDGYGGRKPSVMAQPPAPKQTTTSVIESDEYSETLLEWLTKNILTPSDLIKEIGP